MVSEARHYESLNDSLSPEYNYLLQDHLSNQLIAVSVNKSPNQSDILVVATGRPGLITADMVKPGATIIDVGINRLPNGKLAGDVDFESVKEVAGYITPVLGGVGPMTITMLLSNTIEAAERIRVNN